MGTTSATNPSPATPSIADKIRFYRSLFSGLHELRTEIRKEHKAQVTWKHRFWIAGVVAVFLTGGLVAAISVNTTTFYGASADVFTYDTAVFVISGTGHHVAASTVAAAGTGSLFVDAIEIAPSDAGAANTALTAGHWYYQATLTEVGINTMGSLTGHYKIELFQDGTSKGSVHIKNLLVDTGATEGAVLKWTLGSTVPNTSNYFVKVTRLAA